MKLLMSAVATAALFSLSAFAESWTGTISDAKCGKAHADASEKSMNCVKGCVKGGMAPVFVVGDQVFKIKNADKVMDHLGHKVTVTGKLDGDTVTVDSVKM
jgi:hypothetical protein